MLSQERLVSPRPAPATPEPPEPLGLGRAVLPEPTKCLPGTPEKIVVMAERYDKGQQLFHPRDAKIKY